WVPDDRWHAEAAHPSDWTVQAPPAYAASSGYRAALRGGPGGSGGSQSGWSERGGDRHGSGSGSGSGFGSGSKPRRDWQGRDWKGGGKGWRSRGGDEPSGPRLPPPRTATPLDRAAWLLVHDAQLWLNLPSDTHELLARQPSPYDAFFGAIERLVHDQGPLPMATLLSDLKADPASRDAGPSLALLIERVHNLHGFAESGDPAAELAGVLHQLRLQAVNDEISLISESGDLSDEARQRHRRLLDELRALKAGPAAGSERR
ncbi:MAG: hypothetical protein KGL54_13905, partial [Sphingomonadales bacterium]|nr:hypothetical protein [Sphingomonadales bacterium]